MGNTKRFIGLVALVALVGSLSGCFAFKKDDVNQQLSIAAIQLSAFVGCDQLRIKEPKAAAQVATAIETTVLPLLNGDKPDLTIARDALKDAIGKSADPRYLDKAFDQLEIFVGNIPPADKEQFYGIALTSFAEGCRDGLVAPQTARPGGVGGLVVGVNNSGIVQTS